MTKLIKKDFILIRPWEYITFAIMIVLLQLISVPSEFIFVLAFFSFTITFFFYDHYYMMNRYVRSLPIKVNSIIFSRYISIIMMAIFILAFQYFLAKIISLFNFASYDPFTLDDAIILLIYVIIIYAVSIPLYHLLQSFYYAIFIHFSFFVISLLVFMNLARNTTIEISTKNIYQVSVNWADPLTLIKSYIPPSSLSFIAALSLGFLVMSYFISMYLFKRKDLA